MYLIAENNNLIYSEMFPLVFIDLIERKKKPLKT